MKVLTIIGARPQIIKAAALSRAIAKVSDKITEIIVHTGQHYDQNMSAVFFEELSIPLPNYNLNSGSGKHGEQTAKMISGIEEILLNEQPDCIVLYGDTNSTLAGAIAASKIHVPVVHIEAGLRSFNKSMPEEINRISCDHVSTLLFSPTKAGITNLLKEGFSLNNKLPFTIDNPGVFHCGDIMYDNSLYFSKLADEKTSIVSENKLRENHYILATIHRNSNTDEPENLNALFGALNSISLKEKKQVILPLHPRTASLLEKQLKQELYQSIKNNEDFNIIPPVSFLEMIALEKNAGIIMTDSGGVQKEAYFFKKPCVILREETEWTELVENGCAILAGADKEKIVDAFDKLTTHTDFKFSPIFGEGDASEFICKQIISNFS
ncbi:MAG: UDP-N-acetylglucosamine 2-epimerase (non-hydrolyzing) [Bacteroidota bacterium]|nr:UDP-N-acetylglucosamine 2-epimerase (non-hydrolyzing) [Bacteroidota bacterium]